VNEQDVWQFAYDAAALLGGAVVTTAFMMLLFVWAGSKLREAAHSG
jgi:hypothetical protein